MTLKHNTVNKELSETEKIKLLEKRRCYSLVQDEYNAQNSAQVRDVLISIMRKIEADEQPKPRLF